MEENKSIETSISKIKRLKSGIIRIEIKPHAEITLDGLRENMKVYHHWLKDEKGYFLTVFHELNTAALDIKKEFEQLGRVSLKEAEAFVVASLSNRIELEYYIRNTKAIYPTKLFNDEQEATLWLKDLMV